MDKAENKRIFGRAGMMKLFNRNCCDGIYNSYDVHFTKYCDNKCAFCVDRDSITVNSGKPDWKSMSDAIIKNQDGFDDVLILGGEPCLFIDEMLSFIKEIKDKTTLKVYCTSSVPKTCKENSRFIKVLELLDGFNMSVQHHNEEIADEIRGCKSQYSRQEFYANIPMKEKIRINLNVVKGLLDTKELITECLLHYDKFGFNSFKLSEIQHATESYKSFEKIFGIAMPSPYFGGCQTYVDTEKVLGVRLKTPLLLKRSCFICESSLKASFMDGVKMIAKTFTKQPIIDNHNFGVVYEDGSIMGGWMKDRRQ